MQAEIISYKKLRNVHSASGMEMYDDAIYVCCDDSKYLIRLDLSGNIINKYSLFDSEEEQIPKSRKADFEAMFEHRGSLYLLGSGSNSNRNLLCVFDLQTEKVSFFSIAHIYAQIMSSYHLSINDFNIEGAAIYNQQLLFLNRGDNSIFKISLFDFEEALLNPHYQITIEQNQFQLPSLQGYKAGFSAAIVHQDILYFSASVEKTSDWINDGEILGSYIGKINLCALDETDVSCVLLEGKLKIEAIALNAEGVFIALTDNDGLESEMLEIKINF